VQPHLPMGILPLFLIRPLLLYFSLKIRQPLADILEVTLVLLNRLEQIEQAPLRPERVGPADC
jgi:hypothetical protein